MTLPTVAIVGRPNVGKSTLFNCLTKTRDALVADFPGLTRDRQYGEAVFDGQKFIVIDTGGIGESMAHDVDQYLLPQVKAAIAEADVVLFVIDARSGITAADETTAQLLRESHKKVILTANKIDGVNQHDAEAEATRLGFSPVHFISASHRRGLQSLLTDAIELFPVQNLKEVMCHPDECSDEEFPDATVALDEEGLALRSSEGAKQGDDNTIKLAIIGRPNVGKSTLVNRMLGEDRVVVFDLPGTTRDSIAIPFQRRDQNYILIDTAGIRRRGKVEGMVEKFSVVKTLQAIESAHVVLVILDAKEGITDQDMHLMGFALDAGRAMVIAVNKWDGLSAEHRDAVKRELERRLEYFDYIKLHFISALHGTGVGDLFQLVEKAYKSAGIKMSTSKLTSLLADATEQHAPPAISGRKIKLRFANPGGNFPPTIIIHGNQTESLPKGYKRYLMNYFRKAFKLVGTPIQLFFKTSENPFAGKVNVLTDKQKQKRQRLIRHVKKNKKK